MVISARARGAAFGSETHAITTAELPSHTHTGTTGGGNAFTYRVVATTGTDHANNHANGWTGTSAYADFNDAACPLAAHTHNFTTAATGGGQAMALSPPSLALLYCKKN